MKKVIISGATGMIGTALIEQCLKNNIEVYAIVRPDSRNIKRILNDKIHIIQCDLKDLDKIYNNIELTNFDVFYHLGWDGVSKNQRDDPMLQALNIEYSINALKLAVKLGCKKFIGAGSQAEYGIHKDAVTSPLSETNPVTAYGISKLAAGKLCRIEALKHQIDYAWVRVFSLYGKYENANSMLSVIIPRLLRNEHCSLTEGVQKWDYLYSEDAGKAFYMLGCAKNLNNKIYCLGSGHARTIRSYIEEMREVLNSKSELGFGEVKYELGVPLSICADINDIKSITGWTPETPFHEGIKKEVLWLQSQEGKIEEN